MSLESLAIALSIASFVLAVASSVLAIYSSLWQWRIFRDAQKSQLDAHTLMTKVSEKVDLVATHTSHQVDKAFDVLAKQVDSARRAAAEYETSLGSPASEVTRQPGDIALELVMLDAVWFEVAMLALAYVQAIPGCQEMDLAGAIPAFVASITPDSEKPSSFAIDLMTLNDAFKRAVAGELKGTESHEVLRNALRLAAFIRPRITVPDPFIPPSGA